MAYSDQAKFLRKHFLYIQDPEEGILKVSEIKNCKKNSKKAIRSCSHCHMSYLYLDIASGQFWAVPMKFRSTKIILRLFTFIIQGVDFLVKILSLLKE